MNNKTMVLGIETSCDETAAAVVADGRFVLSNIISSQIETHRIYGGVVPEIASRKHVEAISFVVNEALQQAKCSLDDIQAIAVSNGPGLVGALLVGLSFAKSIAFAKNLPLIGVNHIYSHICANYLEDENFEPPFICLVVSGGHTHLLEVIDQSNYVVLGRTRDDAAGEAFDKVGRSLGLPYPGGPEIDRLAPKGDPKSIAFPRASFENSLDFSFSGLKSAVLQYLHKNPNDIQTNRENIAASFQQAIIDVLVSRTLEACQQKGYKKVALAGGVAANKGIRTAFEMACKEHELTIKMPAMAYCTDNAAMVASGGFFHHLNGKSDSLDLNAYPNMDCVPPAKLLLQDVASLS